MRRHYCRGTCVVQHVVRSQDNTPDFRPPGSDCGRSSTIWSRTRHLHAGDQAPTERTTMRELELDGIHDDGEHLLLVDSDGERYTLRIDKALRAAVRSDRPALNMIQAADAAPVRP